jgi:hypothetical protein
LNIKKTLKKSKDKKVEEVKNKKTEDKKWI